MVEHLHPVIITRSYLLEPDFCKEGGLALPTLRLYFQEVGHYQRSQQGNIPLLASFPGFSPALHMHTIQKKGESPDELSPMHTVFESLTILGTESLC